MSYRIEGVLRTLAPLHISTPEQSRVDPATGRYVGHGQGIPIIRHQSYPLPRRETDIDLPRDTPVIEGKTMLGGLRRAAADLIEEQIVMRGRTIPRETYQTLRSGAPHGHPDKATPTADEFRMADANLFFGLFGGGPRMLPSHRNFDTAYPITEPLIQAGLVPEGYEEEMIVPYDNKDGTTRMPWLTRPIYVRRHDDLVAFADPVADQVVEGAPESIQEWQDLVGRNDDAAEEDEEDDSKKSKSFMRGLRGFSAMEVVTVNVPFFTAMELPGRERHPEQVGFMRMALEKMATRAVGGWSRAGFGRMDWNLHLITPDGDRAPILIRRSGERHRALNTDNEIIADLVGQAETALESLDLAELDSIARPDPAVVDAAREKLNKARAKAEGANDEQ